MEAIFYKKLKFKDLDKYMKRDKDEGFSKSVNMNARVNEITDEYIELVDPKGRYNERIRIATKNYKGLATALMTAGAKGKIVHFWGRIVGHKGDIIGDKDGVFELYLDRDEDRDEKGYAFVEIKKSWIESLKRLFG